ncbi:hypothetical protein BG005_004257, partial [Podila minutissima]
NLNCFTGYPPDNARFKPENDNWMTLYHILDWINTNDHKALIQPYDIQYLRKGFDDPQANAPIWDMRPFTSKQRNHHIGFDYPYYAPTQSMPPSWPVQFNDKTVPDMNGYENDAIVD